MVNKKNYRRLINPIGGSIKKSKKTKKEKKKKTRTKNNSKTVKKIASRLTVVRRNQKGGFLDLLAKGLASAVNGIRKGISSLF